MWPILPAAEPPTDPGSCSVANPVGACPGDPPAYRSPHDDLSGNQRQSRLTTRGAVPHANLA